MKMKGVRGNSQSLKFKALGSSDVEGNKPIMHHSVAANYSPETPTLGEPEGQLLLK
jgi:hypothetical protein